MQEANKSKLIKGSDPRWLSFEEARAWARSSGIKTSAEWRKLGRNGLPSNVPSNPRDYYIDQWKGWLDWLGRPAKGDENLQETASGSNANTPETANTQKVAARGKTANIPFTKAREWARNSGIKTAMDWQQAGRDNLLNGIAIRPDVFYSKQWKGWADWLGKAKPLPFKKAREWARNSGIKTSRDWKQARKNFPPEIPGSPDKFYEKHWKGWADWLGKTDMLPFKKARQWARSSGIKTSAEWEALGRKGLPSNIPTRPRDYYKDQWVDWFDWLGKERQART